MPTPSTRRMLLATSVVLSVACGADPECAEPNVWFMDADGDGFGDPSTRQVACTAPAGAWLMEEGAGFDCDDDDATRNPAAVEICDPDNVDEDCNDAVDDADEGVDLTTATTWYADADGDGFGDPSTERVACDAPLQDGQRFVAEGSDCDDEDDRIHPMAREVCDPLDVDENCNGVADDDDETLDESTAPLWYRDFDRDGYGDMDDDGRPSCERWLDRSATQDDCDDRDGGIHPGATEQCDGLDWNCDGDSTDTGVATLEAKDGTRTNVTGVWLSDQDGVVRAEGERLWLCPGVWRSRNVLQGDGDFEIVGLGDPADIVLDGGGDPSVRLQAGPLTVRRVTLRNGGVKLSRYSTLVVDETRFVDNEIGIDTGDPSDVRVKNSVFIDNTLAINGLGRVVFANVDLERSFARFVGADLLWVGGTLRGQRAWGGSALGVLAGDRTELFDLVFEDNRATGDTMRGVAAAGFGDTDVYMDNVVFRDNTSVGPVGAVRLSGGSLHLVGGAFDNNEGTEAALQLADGAELTIEGTDFTDNDPVDLQVGTEDYALGVNTRLVCTEAGCE